MMKRNSFMLSLLLALLFPFAAMAEVRVYDVSAFGLKAGSRKNASPVLQRIMARIQSECSAEDSVQFVRSETMELVGTANCIASISPYDKDTVTGAREFRIVFQHPVDPEICEKAGFGMENLTWTPEVVFSGNIIRNNRARGTLFSTPRKTVVENNLFDHTSGAAILLCGDCNGWYETGACREVLIRGNRFVNALTNMFQFTNAVISIYPEIPDLKKQQQYFHGGKGKGIVIEENEFDTFDAPILYAKSVDGLIFRNNVIRKNTDYRPFHWNRSRFLLERVTNVRIEED